ncbi:phosphate ABC transporter permease PstA [Streptacidiphilus sp. N1-12]|uniref:Phosphate transport system permease protein PstA n=2 Tax=Streptacidiphilus alkalitolerans TaxID=3342712 RepID=A0ABV6VAF5_9ACTN
MSAPTEIPAQTPTTTLPVRVPAPPGGERPRRVLGARRAADTYAVLGAVAGSLGLTAVLFNYLTPLSGPLGFVLTAWALFLLLYGLLVAQDENGLAVRDRLAAAVIHSLAGLVLTALAIVVGYTLYKGWSALPHGNFYTQDMGRASSLTPLSVGGVTHALVGTLEQIATALLITVPLGVSCAVFLTEVPGGYARFVRTIVEAMTALPSILAGLFVWAVILILHQQQSGFAAGCALSVMMLPIIIRASDVVLRLVPASLKEASYALGSSRLRTVWQVVLPTARSGLATAVILGTARGVGETSPVLLTAGYSKVMNADLFHGAQTSLPLLVFTLVRLPSERQIARGFGAAAVLLVVVATLFVIARVLGGRGSGQLTQRQQRRREAASAATARRFRTPPAAAPAALSVLPQSKDPQVRRRLRSFLHRGAALLAALLVLTAGLLIGGTPPARAAGSGYVPISGAGSTWSSNAMDAWTSDVLANGMRVNFSATGSSDGRAKYKNRAVDFAVSEIPYGITDQGVPDNAPDDPFAYMPIVAGGTSFMYNLTIKGHRVTNLRLSGDVIAKIFTGVIAKWNDPAIKADNPGLALPPVPIVPVVRSDGSGTTAQLTTWMSQREEPVWDAFCTKTKHTQPPCGVTSFYPTTSKFIALNGSTGVSGFVSQQHNAGSITYVEYSYAKLTGFPVVKMLNADHYYVEPTPYNVAVALTKAQINPNLTQNLSGVYDNPDPRAYPLSSYSYMILPVDRIPADSHFTTDKGRTLGAFAYYFLCKGQSEAPDLGYSPLPKNLVVAALAVVGRIPGVQKQNIALSGCDNPTFSANGDGSNRLAQLAPYPSPCDKQGATAECSTGTGGATRTSTEVSGTKAPSAAPTGTGDSSAVGADPVQVGGSATGGDGGDVSADPVSIAATSGSGLQHSLMALAGLLLGSVVILPPVVARRAARRKGEN